jgi:hypothetical protein
LKRLSFVISEIFGSFFGCHHINNQIENRDTPLTELLEKENSFLVLRILSMACSNNGSRFLLLIWIARASMDVRVRVRGQGLSAAEHAGQKSVLEFFDGNAAVAGRKCVLEFFDGNAAVALFPTQMNSSQREEGPPASEDSQVAPVGWKHTVLKFVNKFIPAHDVLFPGGIWIGRLEGWFWFDCLCHSIMAAGTLGHGDFSPKTNGGQA